MTSGAPQPSFDNDTDIDTAKREIAALQNRCRLLEIEKNAAERQYAHLKNSAYYRLGMLCAQAALSWRKALRFPLDVYPLWKEHRAGKRLAKNPARLKKELQEQADIIWQAKQDYDAQIGSKQAEKNFQDFRWYSSTSELNLLRLIPEKSPRSIAVQERRICYLLHNSLPYHSGGYATRAAGVISGLQAAGYDVQAITRPGYPLDDAPQLDTATIAETEWHHGAPYTRILHPSRMELHLMDYTPRAADVLEQKFRALQPAYVLAASNYMLALPALIAARRLGIPFYYEVRGFLEVIRASRDKAYKQSTQYMVRSMMEAAIADTAEHVFTLTTGMRDELVSRGVNAHKISLLPNSCDPAQFAPQPRNQHLADKLGIPARTPVIGYVGSIVDYEGLEDLAEALAQLKERHIDFRFLLVGNEALTKHGTTPVTNRILETIQNHNLQNHVIMPGRVPHAEVADYYSLIDIAPFPRKPWPVCEMVSPMKPLEAMAMQKAVVVSSVAALCDMVSDGKTGMVYPKGDTQALAGVLEKLIHAAELRDTLGAAARAWVMQERTWERIGQKAQDVFAQNTPSAL